MNAGDQQIVVGVSLSASGQATIDPAVSHVLFDLAIGLEQLTDFPVDVEHVLAAVVMAARKGDLPPDKRLSADDEQLQQDLIRYVKIVFEIFGGEVGSEDRA